LEPDLNERFYGIPETSMRVFVKLFATLTHYKDGAKAGTPFDIDISEDAKVIDLINIFHIPPEEAHVIFINSIIVNPESNLKDGDVIGIFPQVGGG
jgi:sulfur-carrier protein